MLSLDTYGLIEHRLHILRTDQSLWHQVRDEWPVSPDAEVKATYSFRSHDGGRYEGIVERDDGIAHVSTNGGTATVNAYGKTSVRAANLLEEMRKELPRAPQDAPDVVTVTFWTLSPNGPQSLRRAIDAPAWSDVEGNYPDGKGLSALVRDWEPGVGGQLILWHGDAGTGKTSALRSLGREWRDWAELHYIVDPDAFFGDSASYMMSVMMGSASESPIDLEEGDPKALRWRLLVLEDCGEMLQPDAKTNVGQALSRLLNACDGLIGRGLRLLILITTNEPLEKIHPAVARPGRCAAKVEFRRFSPRQAEAWLGEEVPMTISSPTLADLYAIRGGYLPTNGKHRVGFATEGSS